jgi:hypothetical protein
MNIGVAIQEHKASGARFRDKQSKIDWFDKQPNKQSLYSEHFGKRKGHVCFATEYNKIWLYDKIHI